jgi:hypothetical protein
MTKIGQTFCEKCWKFYSGILAQRGEVKDEFIANMICTRNTGDPPLYTNKQRKNAISSGNPYCNLCFSTEVTVIDDSNLSLIQSNLPTSNFA